MRVKPHHLIAEALTYSVIGAFYEVYNVFRYGLLERLYMNALELELRARGHRVTRELRVDVMYKGKLVGRQKLDMVVDDKLVIEGKSTFDVDKSALRDPPHPLINRIELIEQMEPDRSEVRSNCW